MTAVTATTAFQSLDLYPHRLDSTVLCLTNKHSLETLAAAKAQAAHSFPRKQKTPTKDTALSYPLCIS